MNLIVISAVITAIFFGAVFVKAHSVCSFAVENQLARRSALIKRQFIFQRLINIHSFLHGSIFKIFAFENISMRRERILGLRKNLIYRSLFAGGAILGRYFFVFTGKEIKKTHYFLPNDIFIKCFLHFIATRFAYNFFKADFACRNLRQDARFQIFIKRRRKLGLEKPYFKHSQIIIAICGNKRFKRLRKLFIIHKKPLYLSFKL